MAECRSAGARSAKSASNFWRDSYTRMLLHVENAISAPSSPFVVFLANVPILFSPYTCWVPCHTYRVQKLSKRDLIDSLSNTHSV
jgi:hypothetical protein